MFDIDYNPDVLTCLANLSNDEVFTPPKIANNVLDLLPEDIWKNKDATFLDPCTKSGIFLREITKRLIVGLENEIPDLQTRIDHIFKNQVFGIGITELTTLLSRRSLYCSKNPENKFSITNIFKNTSGNIIYNNDKHKWKNLKCEYCGASKNLFNRKDFLEQHAYNFIHTDDPKELFKMKFDVIIGNPPYQLSDGGAQASAMPLYHKFIDTAKKLNPRYISMIIPSRWFSGGRGLDKFRNEMINDTRMKVLCDYINARDCFPGVEIKGGVNYFLLDSNYSGKCEVNTFVNDKKISSMKRYLKEENSDIFIRYNEAISIYRKVKHKKNIDIIASSQRPFGLRTFYKGKKQRFDNAIKVFCNQSIGYANKSEITNNSKWIYKHKVIVPRGIGSGESNKDRIKPIYSPPGTACSETYIVFGPLESEKMCKNLMKYMNTKFFHFMVTLRKNTMMAPKSVYSFVPFLDLNNDYNDKYLYELFELSENEINYIEETIGEI